MSRVIDLGQSRVQLAAKRGYRNWTSRFREAFGIETRLSQISAKTLSYLAQARDKGTFYLYDLIMNLQGLGSAFEFDELSSENKMAVIDRYLFLLDRIRFECMKRLGWIDRYPGEGFTLVELVLQYERLGPQLQAQVPSLSRTHPAYGRFVKMNALDQEAFLRKMIPMALKKMERYSTTL